MKNQILFSQKIFSLTMSRSQVEVLQKDGFTIAKTTTISTTQGILEDTLQIPFCRLFVHQSRQSCDLEVVLATSSGDGWPIVVGVKSTLRRRMNANKFSPVFILIEVGLK